VREAIIGMCKKNIIGFILFDMLEKWQIFLFDFDGTLVNTEKLHWQAYLKTCKQFDLDFTIDFPNYCALAHTSDRALRDQLCALFLQQHQKPLDWDAFYERKRALYLASLETTPPELMPGVEELLTKLEKMDVICCVVTHSPKVQIECIASQWPILQTIDHWITREDYDHPKPHPDAYITALKKIGVQPGQKVVGFEDSIRGLEALFGIEADAVLVSALLDEGTIEQLKKVSKKPFLYWKEL